MKIPSLFYEEVAGQPQALRRLIDLYASADGRALLAAVPAASPSLFLGMGASHHSGLIAAHALRQRGRPQTLALEATEAIYGEAAVLEQASGVIYISQSGASGEVLPLLDRLPAGAHVTALTNDDQSPLARQARVVLPVLAGHEETVATKTLTNTLALLWLLIQQWTHELDANDFAVLRWVAGQLDDTLAQAAALAELWLTQLGQARAYVMIGAGLQAITARHTAMILMEWLKLPAIGASVGAFRHGPIEITQPGVGVVVFAAPGPAYASSCQLAGTLADYGASVLLVEQGRTRRLAEPALDGYSIDGALSAILDSLPVQIFAEALAREKGLEPGFRHIEKIVTHI
jgi:glucosamine--fructose-6-phosphate aminotransferase (isomerizing)